MIPEPSDGNGDEGVKSKKVLLRELTSTLAVRAERIRLQQRNEELQNVAHRDESEDRQDGDAVSRQAFPGQQRARPLPVPPSQIPVSQARLRRRQCSSPSPQRKDGGPRRPHTNIRKYRPDYTWNRGGRIKELRIRTVARKFLRLWMQKVFGRVLPSKAEAHYRLVLKKKMFGEWHTFWWELRQEWRLMVRAECHYRYVMWLKVFGAWKDFIVLRTVQNAKTDRAALLYERRLCHKVVGRWVLYWRERQRKTVLRQRAEFCFAEKTLRCVWTTWKEAMDRKHVLSHMESVAMQFWAFRIQSQHWLAWQSAVAVRRTERRRLAEAERHSQRVMAARCLAAWVLYLRRRQTKTQYTEYAGQVHAASVKLRAFSHWCRRWRVNRALTQHRDHMTELANGFQVRRFFCRWQAFVGEAHEEKALIQQADQHYYKHLVCLGLNAFRLCVVQRSIKVMRQKMADHLHYKQVERWAFGVWQERGEEREETQQKLVTLRARQHYRKVLLGKAFQQLLQYKHWRLHRKSQYVKADTHYYLHTTPYCLFRMKVFVHTTKTHRQNKLKAAEFHRESILLSTMATWKQAFAQSKDVRLMERMAILHSEGVLVHSLFRRWKAALSVVRQEREKEDNADEHYRTALSRAHLVAWSQHVKELRQGEENEVKAVRCHYHIALKRSIAAWKQYAQAQRQKHILRTRAERFLQHNLCQRSVAAWKLYVLQCRKMKAAAEVKYQVKCQDTLRQSFRTWLENGKQQVTERGCEQAAAIHFNRSLLTKVLLTWHRYAAIHAYKKSQTRQMVEDARQHLDTCMLRVYLQSWRRAKDRAMVHRLKEERAASHHHRNTFTRAIQQWQLFHSTSIRKKLLQRQSTWFHSVRLTSTYFLLWKERLADSLEERNKSNIALWHWSLVLQKKVLRFWFLHKLECQGKKRRLAVAMETRRARLVRVGASQWLRVAGALAESRASQATRQQVESASTLIKRVHRCALHWKVWAARRALSRLQHPHSLPPHRPHSHSHRPPSPPSLQWSVPRTALLQAGSGDAAAPVIKSELPPLKMAATSPSRMLMISTAGNVGGSGLADADRGKDLVRRVRPKPRRPAFLVQSLQRAGLLTDQHHYVDDHPHLHSPATTDTDEGHQGQPHPDGGHFGVVTATHHQQTAPGMPRGGGSLDFSLSGEVKTGSHSTLEGDRCVRPLRFSNSADTDSTARATLTTSSASPHHVTPTSTRSQPPGNPLLQSSPISLSGLLAGAAAAAAGASRSSEGLISDSDKASGGEDGFRSSDGEILGGNLTRPNSNNMTPAVSHELLVPLGGTAAFSSVPAAAFSNAAPFLMRPEDFLKKRDGSQFPSPQEAAPPPPQAFTNFSAVSEQMPSHSRSEFLTQPQEEQAFRNAASAAAAEQMLMMHNNSRGFGPVRDRLESLPDGQSRNAAAAAEPVSTRSSKGFTPVVRGGSGEFPPDTQFFSRTAAVATEPVSTTTRSSSKGFVPVVTTPRTPRSPRKGSSGGGGGGGSARGEGGGEKLQGILLVKGGVGVESDADVSPLNTARSRGTVTFASPQTPPSSPPAPSPTPAEELRHIRDRLRHFKDQKKKLRRMERQQEQLSTWLQQQDPSDTDATQVTEELATMQEDVASLQTLVSSQRLSCEKLIARARVLSQQLGAVLGN